MTRDINISRTESQVHEDINLSAACIYCNYYIYMYILDMDILIIIIIIITVEMCLSFNFHFEEGFAPPLPTLNKAWKVILSRVGRGVVDKS